MQRSVFHSIRRGALVTAGAALVMAAAAEPARADQSTVTVGLYTPTAPFDGPTQKLEFITSVAEHLTPAADGKRVIGRVYSSARAFAAAVKKGEIQFAVIDSPYAAARGLPFPILAAAMRGGQTASPWQLVSTGNIKNLSDLRGRLVAAPEVGARAAAFITNVLLDGEIEQSYFRDIIWAPNSNSAATMVSLGKADAAFVPADTHLPAGVRHVLTLDAMGWPMLVALPGADKNLVAAFRKAILGYSSNGPFNRFAAAGDANYRGLKASFGQVRRRGIMTVPRPARLTVRDILGEREFILPPSDIALLVQAPATDKAAAKN